MSSYLDEQIEIKNMLEKNYTNNRLSHAYIFHGEEGVGKLDMALYLTAMLYSGLPVDFNKPEVKQILTNTFPNLIIVNPKRDVIVVEDVENMMIELSKTSLVAGPRVFIINEAEKLNSKTANMLLKFIEEPESEEIHGIFITTDLSSILPTIISRCNLVSFKSMNKKLLYDKILSVGVDPLDADIIKELTNSPTDALKLIDDESYQLGREMAMNFIKIDKEFKMLEIINSNREYIKSENVMSFLQIFTLFLEEMLSNEEIRLTNYTKEISEFKKRNDINKIRNLLSYSLEYMKMVSSRVNARNVMIDFVIRLFE